MQVIAFNLLQLSGLILSIFFIAIAFFLPHVKRMSTWYLIMVTEGLYCGSLLLIVGDQEPNGKPPFNICFIQSTLIKALPAGLGLAALAFTMQLYLSVKFFVTQKPTLIHRESWLLLGIPSLAIIVIMIIAIFIGVINPQTVQLSELTLYCHIRSPFLSQLVGAIVCVSCFAAIVMQGMTLTLLYECHRKFSFLRHSTGGLVSWATLLRVFVIDIVAISGIVAGILQSVQNVYSTGVILYTAAIHAIGIAVIGSSTLRTTGDRDILSKDSQLENGNTSDQSTNPPTSIQE